MTHQLCMHARSVAFSLCQATPNQELSGGVDRVHVQCVVRATTHPLHRATALIGGGVLGLARLTICSLKVFWLLGVTAGS